MSKRRLSCASAPVSLFALTLVAAVGCGGSSPDATSTDGGAGDDAATSFDANADDSSQSDVATDTSATTTTTATTDATTDSSLEVEVGLDADGATDATLTDSAPDVWADAAPDAHADVPPDVPFDASMDGAADVPADVPHDVLPDVPHDVLPDVPPDVLSDASADAKADSADTGGGSTGGAWVLWRAAPQAGVFPALAIAPETHTMFYATRFPPSPSDTLGTVWSCDLADATLPCTKLPQTGLTLPPPKPGNAIFNVFSMTTNASGEPIVGMSSPAGGAPTAPELFRYDAATSTWVAPPIVNVGTTTSAPPPGQAMYRLARAPDGTIWGGGQWSGVYRSTDGGKSFVFIDESSLLAKSSPGMFPTRSGAPNDGAMYGLTVAPDNTVYYGTESNGIVYSSDGGASWHVPDKAYTSASSPLAGVTQGANIAGVGVLPGVGIVFEGQIAGTLTSTLDTGARLYLVDPVAQTIHAGTGVPDYFFSGQDVHTIVTTARGTMIFNSGRNFTLAGKTTNYGTPLTWPIDTGGVYASTDGLNWSLLNTGIGSLVSGFFRSGAPGNPAVLGNDVYLATTDGNIWHYHDGP